MAFKYIRILINVGSKFLIREESVMKPRTKNKTESELCYITHPSLSSGRYKFQIVSYRLFIFPFFS